jgi:hypothetical protein
MSTGIFTASLPTGWIQNQFWGIYSFLSLTWDWIWKQIWARSAYES